MEKKRNVECIGIQVSSGNFDIGVPYPHVNTVETGEDYDEDVYEDLEFDELRLEMDCIKIFKT